MPVWPLPRLTFQALSTVEETRPVALLTTEDVWAVLGSELKLPVFIQAEPDTYDRDLFDYLADNLPSRVEAIYVVGQGAPLHAGKIVAARQKRPLVVIPSALDSDALLTPFALAEEEVDGQRRQIEIETGPATEVVIDWDVLRAAPDAERAAAIVDLLSIVTGLLDWRLAAQKGKNPRSQRFTPWAASIAAGLAAQAIKHAPTLGQGRQDALGTLLDLLMMTVQLGNQLGHRRASQGGEHYLARILATQTEERLTHSELVGPCLLFVAALHGQDVTALRETLQHAGVRLDRIRATDFALMLDHLPEWIGTLGLPYSILNELDASSDAVAKALDAAGLAVALDTWILPRAEPVEETAPEEAPAEEAPAEPALVPEAVAENQPAEADTERVEAPHEETGDAPDEQAPAQQADASATDTPDDPDNTGSASS